VVEKSPQRSENLMGSSRYARFRQRLRNRPGIDLAYRILVGVVGTAVLVVGIVAIPSPGPGWLILFAGLAILGTEFQWAQRVLQWTRSRYHVWTEWMRRQPPVVRLAVVALAGVIVVVTLWMVNALGLAAGWVGLQGDWVRSPLA
jgi:uncharacterized protein (TIGR02611 family)